MFKVYRGKLNLNHPDVHERFSAFLNKKIFNANQVLQETKTFLYFYHNIDAIKHPISIFMHEGKIYGPHPGKMRLAASCFAKKDYIDAIFVLNGNFRNRKCLDQIAEDIIEPEANEIVFEKHENDHGQWWAFVSSEQHRYHNDSYDEKELEKKKMEDTFKNFLNTHRKYRWIFEGQVAISGPHPKFDIHVENKTILYNSLYILLNNQSFDGSGIKLKKIRDDQ
jgi:hypothetical protein